MMILKHIATAFAALLATTAHAQGGSIIRNTVTGVAGSMLQPTFGGGGFTGIVTFLRGRILLILAPIGVLLIVRAGIRLISSEDDNKLSKAKNTIAATCVGIMLAAISDRFVMAFFSPGGAWNPGTSSAGATILTIEILGILNWATVLIAVLAALIIIVSGLKTVSSFGKEDTAIIKNTLNGVVAGLLLMGTAGALRLSIGVVAGVTDPTNISPTPIINRAVGIIVTLLGFTALIALAVIVYAGLLMVLNFGNDDQYSKGKSLIMRAVIGLGIMFVSGTSIVFLASFLI